MIPGRATQSRYLPLFAYYILGAAMTAAAMPVKRVMLKARIVVPGMSLSWSGRYSDVEDD
jgi:hypothetical protein